MRRMSFNMMQQQVLDKQKTVTRRLGWKNLKVGERLLAVDRIRVKNAEVLGVIEVVNVRREFLSDIHPKAVSEVRKEGVNTLNFCALRRKRCPVCFITLFSKAMNCERDEPVTRIEFKYVEGGKR